MGDRFLEVRVRIDEELLKRQPDIELRPVVGRPPWES
jgi:hypothetical protein